MIKYRFEYFLTQIVAFFAKMIPLKLAHLVGDLIGDLFFYFIRTRKKVALKNLRASLGKEKGDPEIKKILHQNYRHFGRVLMEFAKLPLFKREKMLEQIPVQNVKYLTDLIDNENGILIFSGHFGNWEYMAAAIANMGPPVYCVFKEQKNLAVDNIIKAFRTHVGMSPLKVKGGAAKGIIKALRERGMVIVLIDQDAGRKGKMVDFLGRPASTSKGPALIAIKHSIPVIMAFGIREEDGKIRVHLEKFPDINRFPDNDEGVKQFLLEYNKILEKYIRKYPEQWFWMHRRWKTQKVNSEK